MFAPNTTLKSKTVKMQILVLVLIANLNLTSEATRIVPELAPQISSKSTMPVTRQEESSQFTMAEPAAPSTLASPEIPPLTRERPSGVTSVSVYYVLWGIFALVTIPFGFVLIGYLNAFGSAGLVGSLLSSLLGLQIVLALIPFILAYGLLKGVDWMRVLVRILAALTIVGSLPGLVLAAMFVHPLLSLLSNIVSQFNQMIAANPLPPDLITTSQIIQLVGELVSLGVAMIYVLLGIEAVIGVIIPAAIFYYLGRRNVKVFFSKRSNHPTSTTVL